MSFDRSNYRFMDAETYEDAAPEYTMKEDDDYEEINYKEKAYDAVTDTTAKGLFVKWFSMFIVIFYIVSLSCQTLLIPTDIDMQTSAWPHVIFINMISHNPTLLMIAAVASGVLSAVILALLFKTGRLKSENWQISDKDTHGSAHFEDDQTMSNAISFNELSNPDGIVLGRKKIANGERAVNLTKDLGRNMNAIIFGATGSGKSYSFARPNILTRIARGDSYFVTDPSGELYTDTAGVAKAAGYDVKILNLSYPKNSNGWNPFSILKGLDETEIQVEATLLVHTILSNTVAEGAKSEAFFDQAEENLLKALILYVAISPHFEGEEYERHMGTVYDLLVKLAAQEGALRELSDLPDTDPAKQPWRLFQGSAKLKSNFIIGLASRIEVFQTNMIWEMFSHDEIDLYKPGREKCAYYVMSPIDNDKMTFILSLFFSCAFSQLIREATKNESNKLDIPTFFILDEFKAIGRIKGFSDKIANVRKYGISVSIIFQDINQLAKAYPNEYESIISNCDTWLALGVNDLTTAELLSSRSGLATVVTQSQSESKKRYYQNIPAASMNVSTQEEERNLMNPDEIMTYFDTNKGRRAIIYCRSKYPYEIDTYDWHLHQLAPYVDKKEFRVRPTDYIPPWQGEEYSLNKRRTFLATDEPMEYGGISQRSNPYDKPKDFEKKKTKGPIWDANANSKNLVSLDL